MGFIIWLMGVVISVLILQWIIRTAIDNSELTKEMKEIKELLKAQQMGDVKELQSQEFQNGREKCPGCGELVPLTDKECKSCGLTLISEDK